MALTKDSYDELFVDRYGNISIRTSNLILEDGLEVAKNYHRKVLAPGDDVKNEGEITKAVAAVVWTQKVIDDHLSKKEAAVIKKEG